MRFVFTLLAVVCAQGVPHAQHYQTQQVINVPEAQQGVAVDKGFFYVINNTSITKHVRHTGAQVAQWRDTTGTLRHLNSGVVHNGKLYCAHSNYPASPMASSIEVFNTRTLAHIATHSFGIAEGSATWIDAYQGQWYVGFAHYTGRGATPGQDNTWTRVVQFDKSWRRTASWLFPDSLVARFGTRSNSGGVFGSDGLLYCTGHDNQELYVLALPKIGYTLVWKDTYAMPVEGQGIAMDEKGMLYGVDRKGRKVVAAVLVE